jgi:hypothetical protein
MRSIITALLLTAFAAPAHAVAVNVTGNTVADAKAAEAAFLSGQKLVASETFETQTNGARNNSFATGVGTFSTSSTTAFGNTGLGILSSGNSPFSGRFNTTVPGNLWLDSFDADVTELSLNLPSEATGLGFFLTDADDQGGNTDLDIFDSSDNLLLSTNLIPKNPEINGTIYFVEIAFHGSDVAKLVFTVNDVVGKLDADGVGFDDFSVVAPVPLPAAGWMLLSALGGMTFLKRRRSKAVA